MIPKRTALNLLRISYKVDKLGHILHNDHLSVNWIEDRINNHGVCYLYFNSRVIDQAVIVQPYLDSLLLTVGKI